MFRGPRGLVASRKRCALSPGLASRLLRRQRAACKCELNLLGRPCGADWVNRALSISNLIPKNVYILVMFIKSDTRNLKQLA